MNFVTRLSSVAALAIACGLAAVPALAVENPGASDLTYRTALTQIYGSQYPVTGSLELANDGNGILHGYYRPDDNQDLIPVTGGISGSHVWIDIGSAGQYRIDGHLDGQKIVGSVTSGAAPGELEFVATPEKSNSAK